jgi:hypothetical protein
MQQVQILSARSNSFLDLKSSSSTTTWWRGTLTRRSLLLRVCLNPQFHFTHQQIMQYTALLLRVYWIETKAALIGHGNCKLSCVVLICLLPSFNSTCALFLEKSWPDYSDIFSDKSNDCTQSRQDAIPHHAFYVSKVHDSNGIFLAILGNQTEKLCWEFFLDHSQWWDHSWEMVTECQTCQSLLVNGAIALVGVNLFGLPWLLSCPRLDLVEILLRSFALVE